MRPFLKWAGGKRWLFDERFVSNLPAFERYVEPFLGGAAGFFSVRPQRAILADINEEVINLYRVVRDHPVRLEQALRSMQSEHSHEFYYAQRAQSPEGEFERAVRTLYLNRTCWNGLYRLNKGGKFNVPIGTKQTIVFDTDDFVGASRALGKADLKVSDFETVIDQTGKGDLVFVDPPYTVKHNMNGFVKYNEKIFTWEDQIRLRDACVSAHARGAEVIVSNADHESVQDLYESFDRQRVTRSSVISGNANARGQATEMLCLMRQPS